MADTNTTTSPKVKIAGVCLILLVLLVSAEIFSRLALIARDNIAELPFSAALLNIQSHIDPYEIADSDGRYHWLLRPGYNTDAESAAADKLAQGKTVGAEAFLNDSKNKRSDLSGIRINAHGYRDEELANPPLENRILMIGDSVTFGLSATTYPDAAETMLRQSAASTEVINAGVEGYSTRSILRNLDQYSEISPDIVTLYIGWNDIYSIPPKTASILDDFAIYRLIRDAAFILKDKFSDRDPKAIGVNRALIDFRSRAAKIHALQADYPHTIERIKEISANLRNKGAKVFVITLPSIFVSDREPSEQVMKQGHLPRFENDPMVFAAMVDGFNEALRVSASEGNFGLIDLAKWAKKNFTPADQYFVDSVHLTPAGLISSGEFIARQLKPHLN